MSRSSLHEQTECPSCGSPLLRMFKGELGLAFPKLRDLRKPPVLVQADAYVCMQCGLVQLLVPEPELEHLKEISEGPTPSAK